MKSTQILNAILKHIQSPKHTKNSINVIKTTMLLKTLNFKLPNFQKLKLKEPQYFQIQTNLTPQIKLQINKINHNALNNLNCT